MVYTSLSSTGSTRMFSPATYFIADTTEPAFRGPALVITRISTHGHLPFKLLIVERSRSEMRARRHVYDRVLDILAF